MDYSNFIDPDEIANDPYIFVSYSRKDIWSVQKVIKILKDNKFRFWYDKGLKSGTEWAEELGDKINRCDQFLVLITESSVKSKYVRKEIGMATEMDKNIMVLYLEETNLTSGLQLLLGDIQAIHKEYFRNNDDFARAICEAASNNTLYQDINIFDESDKTFFGEAKSELLSNYEILTQIGKGGMSQVFLAQHKRTRVLVAVKCGEIDISYPGYIRKDCFYTEREILTMLTQSMCPYTPIILDWFEDDKQIFLVETFVEGEPLKSQAIYSENEIVEIAKKVLNVIKYLHNKDIIYRDIKPNNLIRDKYGEIHLIDFNTAMLCGDETKSTLGTEGFAPPEQYGSDVPVNFSSDIFALGRTMMYLLYPEHFDRNYRYPIRYYRKDISVELEAVLNKMTAPMQEDRYQSVEELLQKLEKYKNTGLLRKIRLLITSQKNQKIYKKTIEKQKKALEGLAVDSQNYDGEGFYEAGFPPDSGIGVDAEEMILFEEGD